MANKEIGVRTEKVLYLKRGPITTNASYAKPFRCLQVHNPYFYEFFSLTLSHSVLSVALSYTPQNNRKKEGQSQPIPPTLSPAGTCRYIILIFMSALASSCLILYPLRHSHTSYITTDEVYVPYYNN